MTGEDQQKSTARLPGEVEPMRGGLRLFVASTLEALEPMADAWDRLAEKAVQRIYTLSYAWVSSYFEHQLDGDESWLCLFALDDEDLVAVLPVVCSKDRICGLSTILLTVPGNQRVLSADFLCLQNREKEALETLIDSLSSYCQDWFELRLARIPELSPIVTVLTKERLRNCLWFKDLNGYGNLIRVTGTYEQYLSSLSPRFARNLRRVARKFGDSHKVETLFISERYASPHYLSQFSELERSGWKGKLGTAIAHDDSQMKFYETLTRKLAARGWLEWHFLKADDRIVAAHLAVRLGSALYLLKIAFDESFSAYSPGSILMTKTIEHAFSAGNLTEVNCLTDLAWNRDWKMIPRAYYDVTLWPRKPAPFMTRFLPSKSRELVRRIPGVRQTYHWFRRTFRGSGQNPGVF